MSIDSIQAPTSIASTQIESKVLPSKLDRFLSAIDVLWGKTAALIEFCELWYFNANLRY